MRRAARLLIASPCQRSALSSPSFLFSLDFPSSSLRDDYINCDLHQPRSSWLGWESLIQYIYSIFDLITAISRTFIFALDVAGSRGKITVPQAGNKELGLLDAASVERVKRPTVSCSSMMDKREQWHFLVKLRINLVSQPLVT